MRTGTGKVIQRLSMIIPETKAERFDPVVQKGSDPDAISDRRLRKMICEAGGARACPKCECFDRCRYGREMVKRHEAGKRALK